MKKLIAFSTALLMIASMSSSLIFAEETVEKETAVTTAAVTEKAPAATTKATEKAPVITTTVTEKAPAATTTKATEKVPAATTTVTEKAPAVTTTAAEKTPDGESTEKADPADWHLSVDKAAEAVMEVNSKMREYAVTVINPGGEKRGGTDKWDVQFRKRTFSIVKDHEYTVTYRISANLAGSYYTKIGNLNSETVGDATAGEVWHNQFGVSTIKSYVEGTVQENAETIYSSAWENQAIGKGDTLNVTCNFTAIESLPEAEWTFFLGGAGSTSKSDCFAPGARVIFSNLTLTDNTTGEVLVSSYPYLDSDVKGDINADGKADISDLSLMCLAKIGDAYLDDAQITNCDVNGSGVFDLADVAHFMRYLSGKSETL